MNESFGEKCRFRLYGSTYSSHYELRNHEAACKWCHQHMRKNKLETLPNYTMPNAEGLFYQQNPTYFVYKEDHEMGSVLLRVVQAPGIDIYC